MTNDTLIYYLSVGLNDAPTGAARELGGQSIGDDRPEQQEIIDMNETVTCTYSSKEQVQNAREDLTGTGIPREKIYVDKKTNVIKVMTPAVTKAEVVEILNRHKPIRMV